MDALIELHRLSIEPLWKQLERPYSLDKIRSLLSGRVEQDRMISVVHGKKVVGFLWSIMYEDDTADQLVDDVIMILIDPEFQSRGIGGRLMEMEREHARVKGADIIKLQALTENKRALQFYERQGFKEVMRIMISDL